VNITKNLHIYFSTVTKLRCLLKERLCLNLKKIVFRFNICSASRLRRRRSHLKFSKTDPNFQVRNEIARNLLEDCENSQEIPSGDAAARSLLTGRKGTKLQIRTPLHETLCDGSAAQQLHQG
jgi:hypothetical protein